jgi:hypothetical protein
MCFKTPKAPTLDAPTPAAAPVAAPELPLDSQPKSAARARKMLRTDPAAPAPAPAGLNIPL